MKKFTISQKSRYCHCNLTRLLIPFWGVVVMFRVAFIIFFIVLLAVSFPFTVFSQSVLATYSFEGESLLASQVPSHLFAGDFSISSGSITFGESGMAQWSGSAPYAQGASGWGAQSPSGAKYFSFSLLPDITHSFTLSRLTFEYRATDAGPSAMTIMIDTLVMDSLNVPANTTMVYDTVIPVPFQRRFNEAQVRIKGWDNGSRVTSGNGHFRINDVSVYGDVVIRPVIISFDTDYRWTEGSGPLGSSYQTDHAYQDLGVVFSGGEAMRDGTGLRDGIPSALGVYSWRLRDNEHVEWTGTLQRTGTLSGFGFKVRRWDGAHDPDVAISYSIDSGSNYTEVETINNTLLNDSSGWVLFTHEFSTEKYVSSGDFIVKLKANQGNGQQVMIDDFQYTLLCAQPRGWLITNSDQLFTIDFNSTVEGVNHEPFQGRGFSFAPAPGELDSRAWSISGLSDGDMPLGNIEQNGDFARGTSSGGVTTGGIYAFEVEPNNFSLGVQPTEFDMNPGIITLKVSNHTGETVHSLALAYKVWQYNDEERSVSMKISYSDDNDSYTPVPQLHFFSDKEAASQPLWQANYRTAKINNLNIPDDGHIYLQWTIADHAGTDARDELALDHIQVVFNPVSTFPPVGGTYQSAAIHREAILDSPLTITDSLIFTGHILQAGSHWVTFEANSTTRGQGPGSYINGTVKMKGAGASTLPAGHQKGAENHFGAVTIDNTAGNSSDLFAVTYHYDMPPDYYAFDAANHALMKGVSRLEYWTISRENGTSAPHITLHWDETDDGTSGIADPPNICVAHWNALSSSTDKWEDLGGTNPTETATGGSITANNVNAFSLFTFGTYDLIKNPLPIELISFSGSPEKDHNRLEWTTASQVNNHFFTLERASKEGNTFIPVQTVPGAGTVTTAKSYSVKDYKADSSTTFYRLRQTDYDGQYSYSPVIQANRPKNTPWRLKTRSINNTLWLTLKNLSPKNVYIQVYNIHGQLLNRKKIPNGSKSLKASISIPVDNQLVILRVSHNQQVKTKKLVL